MIAMQWIERLLRRMLAGIGAVCVLSLFGLTTAFLVNACTGSQIDSGSGAVRVVSSVVPAPAGPLVQVAASQIDAAIKDYLEAHPEKRNEKWGFEEWGAVLGAGLFGGGLRRKTTTALASLVKPFPAKTV